MTRSFTLAVCLTIATGGPGCGDDASGPGPGGGIDSGPSTGFDSGPFVPGDSGGPGPTDSGPVAMTDSGGPTETDAGEVMATGACTNAADDAIFMSTDVVAAVEDCAGDCFGARDCTTECVVRETSLSMACAGCFGDASQCTVDNCAFRCFGGGDSPDCMACRDEAGCTAAFETCSGRM